MSENTFTVTREKHLDHLVRVVPLIVLGYAIQCYMLTRMKGPIGGTTLVVLALSLSLMIAAFIAYDVKHSVVLFEDRMEISFFFYHLSVPFKDILSIHVLDEKESFGSVVFHTSKGKIRLYFVDSADKIKQWIDSKNTPSQLAA